MKNNLTNKKYILQVSKKIPDIPVFTLLKISPEKSRELLQKAGLQVSNEQAEEVMEFLYMLTEITLKEFFAKNENS